MKIINRERFSGKSMMLLYSAYTNGQPIIVYNLERKNFLLNMAKELNVKVHIYTLQEYRETGKVDPNKGILIDDAEKIIENALNNYLRSEVVAITLCIPCEHGRR